MGERVVRWMAVVLLAGCVSSTTAEGPGRDAAPAADQGPGPDGEAGSVDGGLPDGAPADARVGDGRVEDAATPDAAPPAADAAPPGPDAAPPCPQPASYWADTDGDGFGDPATRVEACEPPPGYVDNADDCNDDASAIHPDASERCDTLDNDCNGVADDFAADARPYFRDEDGDGVGDSNRLQRACVAPQGFVAVDGDCDDTSPAVGACAEGTFCSVTGLCLDLGACRDNLDCPADHLCSGGEGDGICVPGSLCGGERFAAERITPDLLIVLDRSCSMRTRVAGVRKWNAAVDAINAITRDFEGIIRFGLTLFPDRVNPDCRQADIPIPLADGNEQRIRDLLTAALDDRDRNWPDGPCVTNIDTAMQQAATDPGLGLEGRRSYVMLVTDGSQAGCNAGGGNQGTLGAIRALFGERGVATFVVGFGGAVNARWLTDFANAGGVPRAGDLPYYQADDAAGLSASIREIAAEVVTCDFALEREPPDPARLAVFLDGARAVRDDRDGWSYDEAARTVTLHGPACDRLRAGDLRDVEIIFGCES